VLKFSEGLAYTYIYVYMVTLQVYGVLEYSEGLAGRVARKETLAAGSEEEVEIRAATVREREGAKRGGGGFRGECVREVVLVLGPESLSPSLPDATLSLPCPLTPGIKVRSSGAVI
jgi:hypothetical protein